MKKLEEQIKDWEQLKKSMKKVGEAETEGLRKHYLGNFYEGIKMYWEKYQTKFNCDVSPGEE